MIVGVLASCKNEESIPTKPNNNQTNGNGILSGSVSLFSYFLKSTNLTWDTRQAGIHVQIIGTQISTETDGYGEFVLRGVDSGSYSLQFSKAGYETFQLDNIQSNGVDSIAIKNVITDSSGIKQIYNEVFLSELTPTFSITNSSATAVEVIHADTTTDHGVIIEIRRDTTYSWQAAFSINLQSNTQETQDSLPAGFLIRITSSNTVTQNEMPTAFYDTGLELTNGWLGFYGHTHQTKPTYTGTRDFVLKQSGSDADRAISLAYFSKSANYQVRKTEQLYLHIVPVVKELRRVQHSNRFNTWYTFEVAYKFGNVVTLPIQWQ